MDIFDAELLHFWACLNKRKVKYIMVGGVATNLNGYQRSTEDVDVWLKETKVNRENFRKAYEDYSGENYYMINTMQIVPGWTCLYLNNGYKLDLMVNMKGLEGYSFEQCLKLAGIADIDGVLVPFLHINHLIANKKAVNRPKDQIDVIYLERIKEIRQNEGL
ncbi:MAG TPA: nucleotidyltransferase [Niabella sp.]|nr:nucleotidyltransferase [Niabella sp.]